MWLMVRSQGACRLRAACTFSVAVLPNCQDRAFPLELVLFDLTSRIAFADGRCYLASSIPVTVKAPPIFSAENLILSPALTLSSIAGSFT